MLQLLDSRPGKPPLCDGMLAFLGISWHSGFGSDCARRCLTASLCVLAAGLSLSGLTACGSSSSAVVVQVGAHAITKATLNRWTAIEAILSYEFDPSGPVPKGVVPDPPSYTNCIAYLRKTPPALTKSATDPSSAQLKRQCEQKQELLEHHMLDILITYYWLSGEAASRGVKVTAAELKQTLARQFPSEAAFHRFLALTGETASDERLLLTKSLLDTKLQQSVMASKGLTSKQQQEEALIKFSEEFARRWTARTSCRPGYVVSECRQYKGPKTPLIV